MKAMRKVSRGSGFRGALNYVFGRSKEERDAGSPPGRLLGGNMLGHDPRSLAAEFKLSREQRQDVAKPVWHQALRLPPGEQISDQQWVSFADDYMAGMGFTDQHQRAYVLHEDEPALHIVASRIALDGSLYLGKNENLQTTKLVAELEKKHGLRITVTADIDERTGLPSTRSKQAQRAPKKGEIEKALRTGFQPARLQIQAAVDAAVAAHPKNLSEFRAHLAAAGVTLHVHNHPETGKPRGVSFKCEGSRFSGSQLGEAYKLPSLQRRTTYASNSTHESRTGARIADPAGSPTGNQTSRRSAGDPQAPECHGTTPARAGERPTRLIQPVQPVQVAPAASRPLATQKESNMNDLNPIGFLSSTPGMPTPTPRKTPNDPPTLGGRLKALQTPRGYDLYWDGREKASMRWEPQQQRLCMLAQPSPKGIEAMFDAAREKGIGIPSLRISGTEEFQLAAVQEAAKRGLLIDTDNLSESARDAYERAFDAHHGDTVNALTTAAYESADRHAEASRPKSQADEPPADRDDDRQHMRMG